MMIEKMIGKMLEKRMKEMMKMMMKKKKIVLEIGKMKKMKKKQEKGLWFGQRRKDEIGRRKREGVS